MPGSSAATSSRMTWNSAPTIRPVLLSGVAEVGHIAASTSFDEREKDAIYQGNVLGTENMLALTKKLSKLENFLYISTAYVAGLNPGPVAEDEMPALNGFRNTYEATKWEAENLVRQSRSALHDLQAQHHHGPLADARLAVRTADDLRLRAGDILRRTQGVQGPADKLRRTLDQERSARPGRAPAWP